MKIFWKILLSAVAVTIIAFVLHMADGLFGMQYYTDPSYYAVWSEIMMPESGPPPMSFYYLSVAFNFVVAVLFTTVYLVIKRGIPGESVAAKGAYYGLLMFLVAGVSGALSMYLLFYLPVPLILLWTVEGFAINILGGMAIAGINK